MLVLVTAAIMVADSVGVAMVEASPDGMLLVDADGVILFANSAASELFGYEGEALVGATVEQLMPAAARADHVRERQTYLRSPSRRPMNIGLELYAQRQDESLVPVEISLSPVVVDGEQCTIATVRDVSERRSTAAKVALLSERERIARDIHDMVIQRLFAAGMQLQAVAGLARPAVVAERVDAVVGELDDTIAELRSAIFQLGVAPVGSSLTTQIAQLVDRRREQLGFAPELVIDGNLDTVPDFVTEQLIATVTESLSNVARHANASAAVVRIATSGDRLELSVADNGRGIVGAPKPNGGLSNIVWRATELGGSCTVRSGDPSGTVIDWHVPV